MITAAVASQAFADLVGPADGVRFAIWDGAGAPPSDAEIWVPPYLAGNAADLQRRAYAGMPRLTTVLLPTAGSDAFLDLVPAHVTLCDAQGAFGGATAEWVLTAVLAALREFPRMIRAQAARQWAPGTTDELAGKRVLVVGAGDLGTQVARRMTACDADCTLVARRARPGVHAVAELPGLLPHADVVVLVVPLTPATRGLVDAAFLARMPDGALLVNAARGPVVETAALVAEVSSGRLAAALDVTDPEPLPAEHPLWGLPNVLITPHVGGNVNGSPVRVADIVRAQLGRYVRGEPLENVVVDGY